MNFLSIFFLIISLVVSGISKTQRRARQIALKHIETQQEFEQRMQDRIELEEIDQPPKKLPAQKLISATKAPTPTPATALQQPESKNDPWYYYNQGFSIWVQTKDYEKAAGYYQQALDIDPDFAPALSSYGFIQGAFYKKYDLAHKYLEKAQKIDPNWAYAPFNQGLLYSIQSLDINSAEMHQQGIDKVQFAVDNFPNHPDIDHFKEHLREMKRYHNERFPEK